MTRRAVVQSLFFLPGIVLLGSLTTLSSVGALGCGAPTAPSVPAGAMRVSGTAHFFDLEGGFWAIRGDDGVTYDPKDGLPAAFRRDGMRLSAVVKTRSDLGGIHMVGPIVEILDIKTL
jgi:hypothetical protein